NKTAILLDDMIDTGGTIVQAAQTLIQNGASSVYACCTHPVLSGNAVEKLKDSSIQELVVTNTIPLSQEAEKLKNITLLDVSSLLGEAIKRIYRDESVSSLFI
ncbi:MAG: ribose-phosphate diphosphokinase, partial [Syntrophorhabdaceae bacterium]|nr:ribose-phosphate diphosphokinase [Syntrophorhabdaceae bacterium]